MVFYDYDEISYLTECNFRHIPPPPYPEFEMSDEPWFTAGPHDIFPEEWSRFLLNDNRVRKIFMELHSELLQPEYWQAKQDLVRANVYEDVFPYNPGKRFSRRQRSARRRNAGVRHAAA